MVDRYQSKHGSAHWTAVKHIMKYLRGTKDYMLLYCSADLISISYTDSDFSQIKNQKNQLLNMFSLWEEEQ